MHFLRGVVVFFRFFPESMNISRGKLTTRLPLNQRHLMVFPDDHLINASDPPDGFDSMASMGKKSKVFGELELSKDGLVLIFGAHPVPAKMSATMIRGLLVMDPATVLSFAWSKPL